MTAAEVERNRLETEWGRSRRLYDQKMIATETYDQATAARNVAAERYRQDGSAVRPCEGKAAAGGDRPGRCRFGPGQGPISNLSSKGPRKETIDQARANVRQAEAALTMAQVKLSYAKVYSPLDGVVLSKNIEPGEYVAPGTPVVTVADLDNIWLRAYVDEMDLDRVKLGQSGRDHHRLEARQDLCRPRRLHRFRSGVHAEDRADGEGAGEAGVSDQDRHQESGGRS